MRVICTTLIALVAIAPAGAVVKPKPWMWTPAKMSTRMVAAQPFAFGDGKLLAASCSGRAKAVAGRYTSFACTIKFGSSNGSYNAPVQTRVLAVGTGKLCITANAEGKALPHTAGTRGIDVVPSRVCP